ncbi:hypothetical protein [Mycobacterium talmoniae]|uniref:Uncharacterized protein n=1 Tax=Mycobacterium talmoniae TaxID=1858794 RepID=A0A1S1NHQ1_9MYCO|nr:MULTISPECIES: hypothetical protein [Mycobacterium]OHV05334.1 hypothetical protein BKN37_06200 [Mycobacterium talmoniae]PQM44527.1 hypothetical protein C1Y40_05314 [Mycobacterium talmoniae]TDH48404.1 hypothetical protein E2F47_23840 [Mycobacterium eburneum]
MATISELVRTTGVSVLTPHDGDVDIPVLSGMQRQGDVLVLPAAYPATTAVPASGTPVVHAENGGNTHVIYAADGPVYCDTDAPHDLRVASLTVPDGSIAYLGHPEHGYMGIAPGSYEIRRRREMGAAARLIAD